MVSGARTGAPCDGSATAGRRAFCSSGTDPAIRYADDASFAVSRLTTGGWVWLPASTVKKNRGYAVPWVSRTTGRMSEVGRLGTLVPWAVSTWYAAAIICRANPSYAVAAVVTLRARVGRVRRREDPAHDGPGLLGFEGRAAGDGGSRGVHADQPAGDRTARRAARR